MMLKKVKYSRLMVSTSVMLTLLSILATPGSSLPSWLQQPIEVVSEAVVDNPLTRLPFGGGDNNVASSSDGNNATPPPPNNLTNKAETFTANCLLDRQPQWTDNPTLHFFSSKIHSKKSLGCTPHLSLSLNITKSLEIVDGDFTTQVDSSLRGLVVDERGVKRNLTRLYNGSLPTYLMIHGFMSSWNEDNWMCHTKDMVLNNTQANVFIVDWSGGAKPMLPIDYGQAVTNTRYVGLIVGSFIKWLLAHSKQNDASRFHLIGHSLGAHIAGYIGYYIGSMGRITGLDPAGPCFTTSSNSDDDLIRAKETGYLDDSGVKRRLSVQSADLVVAMHTDTSLFGLNDNCAHYNVYVNGGSRQPICKGLVSGVSNLLVKQSLDLDISCAHSYAHMVLDSFALPQLLTNHEVDMMDKVQVSEPSSSPATTQVGAQRLMIARRHQAMGACYPIAYRCRSWEAFKSGECGFCADNSTSCVYTGVELSDAQRDLLKPEGDEQVVDVTPLSSSVGDDDDDDKFNGEGDQDYEEDEAIDSAAGGSAARSLKATALGGQVDPTPGQHFLKSAPTQPTCLYHYQVVIAVVPDEEQRKRRRRAEAKRYYYLQVPLDKRATLLDSKGQRLRDRLVQVSHVASSSSVSLAVLRGPYLDKLRRLYSATQQLRMSSYDLDFYTALITFESTIDESSKESGNWLLTRPLLNLREARLWSATSERLKAVRWVGLNYMSGLTERVRDRYSHLFTAAPKAQVKSREQLAAVNEDALPSIDEIHDGSQRSSSGWGSALEAPFKLAGQALKPVNCLVSSLWEGGTGGSSANNFKCGRGSTELKFSLRLSGQIKQQQQQQQKPS